MNQEAHDNKPGSWYCYQCRQFLEVSGVNCDETCGTCGKPVVFVPIDQDPPRQVQD